MSVDQRTRITTMYRLDRRQLLAIKNLITSIYADKKEPPTITNVLQATNEKLGMRLCEEFFCGNITRDLGYEYWCLRNKLILIEKHEIRLNRANILHTLIQNSTLGAFAKTVVYLDETWLQLLPTLEGFEDDDSNSWFIKMNGGGRMGLIPIAKVCYKQKEEPHVMRSNVTATQFNDWLASNLIQLLPEKSIVVLGNTPYRKIQVGRPPNPTSTREDLVKWLKLNDISFDDSLLKVQLYDLVKSQCPAKTYVIDKILKKNGHEVLRLPAYNYDLNPMEATCKILREKLYGVPSEMSVSNQDKLPTDLNYVHDADWIIELTLVMQLEKEYWEKEKQVELEIEKFMAPNGGSESHTDSTQ